jgi:16S rRNA (cytosine1402-N4)-methyltransferase
MDVVFEHEPVMRTEIVELFTPAPAGTVVDATVGGGGHAEALLSAHPHLRVVGLDRDRVAVEAATTRLARFGERARVVHARFDRLDAVLDELGIGRGPDVSSGLVGALFDLGVSSPQLDEAERGFSYRFDAPLDMRMDRDQPLTAAHLLDSLDEADLARLLREQGDEPHARRIARAIVAARPISSTGQLVDVVRAAVPSAARRRRGHPAKRVFQAVRIAVNAELDVLPVALERAIDRIEPGGRVAVLAYHSGEDRIVKERLREAETGGCTCPPRLGCVCGAQPRVRLLWRGARKPGADEIARNPRAESARLRAAEKLMEVR